ncbi:MAG: HAMP domain-containing histidine kinase [Myxococcales bacterium]|nr:HAMP domain-containing histidine kinase [Myxococcales bacterium]
MTVNEQFLNLAPTDLEARREPTRYDGGGFGVRLNRFVDSDVELFQRVYEGVKRAHALWLDIRDHVLDVPFAELLRRYALGPFREPRFLLNVRAMGAATFELGVPPRDVRGALHDIRSGALLALIGYAVSESKGVHVSDDETRTMVLRARDHARIMRNAIIDLDPVRREVDEHIKSSSMQDFVAKWDGSVFRLGERLVSITFDCQFDGNVTHHDSETAALDRVLYNHVNNAARFAGDDRVRITALRVNDRLVRWVVENTLLPDHNFQLIKAFGGDLSKLYQGGFTRGGHGIGLSLCAEIVGAAVGVREQDELLTRGYIGAEVHDHRYLAWFHWPVYSPGQP